MRAVARNEFSNPFPNLLKNLKTSSLWVQIVTKCLSIRHDVFFSKISCSRLFKNSFEMVPCTVVMKPHLDLIQVK